MPKRNIAWILVIAMITLLMWQLPQTIAGRDAIYTAFGPLVDVRDQIRKRFVDNVDEAHLAAVAVDAGVRAMIASLHDPYAVYLPPAEYDRFKNRTEGVFGGIGVEVWAHPLGLEVLSRAPNSPAANAGILPGDVIIEVDDQPTTKFTLVEAVHALLNGPPGSLCKLNVRESRGGSAPRTRLVTVERGIIDLDPVRGWSRAPGGGWRFMLDAREWIGYIRLVKFTQDVAARMDAEMERLRSANVRALILDLRDNTGGLLESAREVADRFLEQGLIVRTAGRRTDTKEWLAQHEGTYPPLPLVVLINESTASAAEIVAGALRDHRRAVVVGERSYGKGSVQEVVELDRRTGAIKLTTAYYYLPGGQCIQRTARTIRDRSWGVAPDVTVSMTPAQRDRCLAAWREISREVLPLPTTTPSSTQTADDTDELRAATARALLSADPQLRRALEILRARLRAGRGAEESTGGPQASPERP